MIRKLTEGVIRLIAAGEVVEGPWSVVKELVENSLDAGASRIEVYLEDGGLEEITVRDDGIGMNEADLALAFERHTTSKIATAEDLARVETMGFRGEALTAIAAVSEVTAVTKPSGELLGHKLVVSYGCIGTPTAEGAPDGTTVTVKRLFKNVPARLKFVAGKRAETRKAVEQFKRIALARTAPELKLVSGGRLLYACAGNSGPRERIGEVLGWEILEDLIPLRLEDERFKISGYVSRPDVSWNRAARVYTIICGRPARNRAVFQGLMAAYGPRLEKGRYPTAVIYLDADPAEIDVNVHPRKEEVRFADEDAVARATSAAVASSVGLYRPSVPLDAFEAPARTPAGPKGGLRVPPEVREAVEGYLADRGLIEKDANLFTRGSASKARGPQANSDAANGPASVNVMGQLYNKYIIADTGKGLVLMDQHTAHERVIYEKLRKASAAGGIPEQKLLVPVTARLNRADLELAKELNDVFAESGFEIEFFGGDTFAVKSHPTYFDPGDLGEFLEEVLGDFSERGGRPRAADTSDRLLKSIACRAAVKAGQTLEPEEMAALVEDLLATEDSNVCPHGRPTMVDLPDRVLDRLFGRR